MKRILIIAGLAALMLGSAALWRWHGTGERPPMITVPAKRMHLEEAVLASGVIHAANTVDIGAQVSGQLQRLYVQVGDSVRRGQLLAEIDPKPQRNALKRAQAAQANVEAQKRSKEAQLVQYRLELERQQRMRSRDASAQADLEAAVAQAAVARADIAALEAQIIQARTDVDTATVNLGYTRIVAPIDGVVVGVTTKEGQTIIAAQTVPTILTLAVLDTVTIKAEISEADVSRVRPGQEVYFTTLGDQVRHVSTLRAVEPGPTTTITDSTSASSAEAIYYNGLFDLPNPEHRLRIGMTVQVSIVLGRVQDALCVPVSALGNGAGGGTASLAVLRGMAPEKITVRTGLSDKVHIEVVDGLHDGDEIVVGDAAAGDLPVETVTRRRGPGGPPPGAP